MHSKQSKTTPKHYILNFFSILFSIHLSLWATTIELKSGWNLVGTNVDISSIKQVIPTAQIVWKYEQGQWFANSPNESFTNTLDNSNIQSFTAIKAGKGFWVKVPEDNPNVSITLADDNLTSNTLTITKGWNLLSLPTTKDVNNMNKMNHPGIKAVWRYENNQWFVYTNNENIQEVIQNNSLVNNLDTLKVGDGFWIDSNVTEEFNIIVDNSTDEIISSSNNWGVNLTGVNYWSTEWPFLNIAKSSVHWYTHCNQSLGDCSNVESAWDTKEQNKLITDENGYVKSFGTSNKDFTHIGTLLWLSPSGVPISKNHEYVVTYDGQGDIRYKNCSKIESSQGRDIIKASPNGNSECFIDIYDPDINKNGNYIRNINVLPNAGICGDDIYNIISNPNSCENNDFVHFENLDLPFHPTFLKNIKSYGLLRFMDWSNVYHDTTSTWENRAQKNDSTYMKTNGVPYEMMIKLQNITNKDGYYTLPVRADNNYFIKFANLIETHLETDKIAYVELGNEVWNSAWAFQEHQNSWVEEQGNEKYNSSDNYANRLNWYAYRTNEMCDILKTHSSKIQCIIGAQAANTWITENYLLNCSLEEQSCYNNIDYLSIAPYFGFNISDENSYNMIMNKSNSELYNTIINGEGYSNQWIPELSSYMDEAYYYMSSNKEVADKFGLKLMAYEGGQHFVAIGAYTNDKNLTNRLHNWNNSLQMGSLYTQYMQKWDELTDKSKFSLFSNVSSWSKYGSWGLIEDYNSTTPKYEAILEHIQ